MAFPVIEATNTSAEAAATTSHTVSLPAGIASGDLLIVVYGFPQGGFPTTPSGWTDSEFLSHSTDNDVTNLRIWTRTADGAEGSTLAVTTANSRESAHAAYRISGWSSFEFSADAESASAGHPDPPSLTPSGGADDYLWIAVAGALTTRTVDAAPTNYSNFLASSSGDTSLGEANIGVAARSVNASSEDPGTFTSETPTDNWVATTMAVFPSASETPVSNARTLESHHFLGGTLPLSLSAYHMAAAGSPVSNTIVLPSHHLLTVSSGRVLHAYHMAGVQAPITPSGDTGVSRAFSIPVFEFGEDLGGTIDFTVDS